MNHPDVLSDFDCYPHRGVLTSPSLAEFLARRCDALEVCNAQFDAALLEGRDHDAHAWQSLRTQTIHAPEDER